MLGRLTLKRAGKLEGESPFWISFSDLMSALMVLFLVVTAVTILAVNHRIDAETREATERAKAIREIMKLIEQESSSRGVEVDGNSYRVDLGKNIQFDSGSYAISLGGRQFLQDYVPVLLKAKESPEGQRWIRNVVVEGYTDDVGTYLHNLGLSLNRSRSVVCSLFPNAIDGTRLSADQLRDVQELFLVGGYSFNSIKQDRAQSRRVEFKLDFWSVGETPTSPSASLAGKEFGAC